MKYYQIAVSGESKIIGIKNGTSQVENLNSELKNSQEYIDFENHFSGFSKDFWANQNFICKLNPPLIKGRLRKGAKITDIMRYGQAFHFLNEMYSEKYINILKSFNIGQYKTFEFAIEDVDEKYYLFFPETILLKDINYDKSSVVTGFKKLNNIVYHTVKNVDELILFKKKEPISTFETVAITKEYFGKDLIAIQGIVNHFYSENLIDFLLDCGVTGLQIGYNNSIKLKFI